MVTSYDTFSEAWFGFIFHSCTAVVPAIETAASTVESSYFLEPKIK